MKFEDQFVKLAEEDMKTEDKVYIEVAVKEALKLKGNRFEVSRAQISGST